MWSHLHTNQRLQEETSKFFNWNMSRMDGLSPSHFHGVHLNDIPVAEGLLLLNTVLYDVDCVTAIITGEVVWQSVLKYENIVRLLRYNCHICYVSNINAVFQSFRCPNCKILFNGPSFLEQYLTACSERVKTVYPRNVYRIRETLFDKLDSSGFEYTSEQKLFKILAMFDFESIFFQKETFRDTNTTTWIGKHVQRSVSISSNIVEEPIFLCNSDPHHLVSSFLGTLANLASQSKMKIKNLFLDTKTTVEIKLGSILEKLTQRHSRREQMRRLGMNQDVCETE